MKNEADFVQQYNWNAMRSNCQQAVCNHIQHSISYSNHFTHSKYFQLVMPENKLSNVNLSHVQLNIYCSLQWLHSAQHRMRRGCGKAARETQRQCMVVKWTAQHSAVTEPTTLQSSASTFPQASCALLPSLFCGGSSTSSCLGKRIQVKRDFVAW